MSWTCKHCQKRIDDLPDHKWSGIFSDGFIHPYHKACLEKVLGKSQS